MRPLLMIVLLLTAFGCSKSTSDSQNESSEWLIDEQHLAGEFSLFPLALDPPTMIVSDMSFPDGQLVGVVILGSKIRVYPYLHALQSEIINDEFNGQKIAFSYCPITKSSLAFKRSQVFRASGYLYKDNLTPWDEQSESIWSQMLIRGIKGPNINVRLNTIPVVETRWSTIRTYFPNATVVPNFNASRLTPPDEETDDENAPELNELAYGILNEFDDVHIFKYSDFASSHTINTTIQSQNYIVYGDASKQIINAFKVPNFNTYQVLEDQFPYILRNTSGVNFDIFGRGTDGSILEKPKYAYVAIWRAWDDFYNDFTFQN